MASTEFKSAIKSSTREIKGYCIVDYTNDSTLGLALITGGSPESVISYSEQVSTTNGIVNTYASFENQWFKTDGNMILPNDPSLTINEKVGYISNGLTNTLQGVECWQGPYNDYSYGISFYFDEDYPIDGYITVGWSDSETHVFYQDYYFENNDKKELLFNDYVGDYADLQLVVVYLYITKYSNPNHRLKISGVNAGLIGVHKDNELISMNINEETDITNQTTPISDCSISLNNYGGEYDILNTTGLSSYLKDGIMIKPYIGCVIESGLIEYEPMGIYYLTDWNNNEDQTTTINGQNYLRFLANVKSGLRNGWGVNYIFPSDYFEGIMNNLGITNYNISYYQEDYIDDLFLKGCYANEQINMMNIISQQSIFYVDREGNITLATKDIVVNDTLSLNEFKGYPKITTNKKIQKIIVTIPRGTGIEDTETVVYSSLIKHHPGGLTKVYVEFDYPVNFASSLAPFTVTAGTITKQFYNFYSVYLEVTGTSDFTLTMSAPKATSPTYETYTYTNDLIDKGDTLEVNLNGPYSKDTADVIANNLFTFDYTYTINCDSIGDPSIKAGDLISIETKNGYKNIYINKLSFNYDGSLSCNIEGVGN